ncbi:hypothetical protein [Paenibacillus radicis (ex Gao et al. 2016)]|uniref:DUF3887 domain-containing protein n=1 Tax=Paenibacillus radicis (ex Gao et al. 2016) TaxID=1737354 RepID=A0A917M1X7_9BACL|nr:hypothetical protein [Paenibacillus radicis (ex Gao et al. 2016)]GGG72209.1 hypothetical protein GCM10010918_29930 [Paenibacillus radicis (ex Gao et al. 2016)]
MRKSLFLFSFIIAVTALSGQVVAASNTVAASKASPAPTAAAVKQNNPYEVAGIDNAAAFSTFFSKLQKEVKAKNKEAVAGLVSYPLRVNSGGKSIEIKNKKQFIAKYNQIITDKVKKKLLAQKEADLFVNWKGVMVGDGEVWIGQFGKKIAVFAINK